MYNWCQKNIPIYFKLTRLIVIDIGWSPVISICDCHLVHGTNIGPFSATATKYLHWALVCRKFCQKIFGRIFQIRFAKGRVFFGASFPNTSNTFETSSRCRIGANAALRSLVDSYLWEFVFSRQTYRNTDLFTRIIDHASHFTLLFWIAGVNVLAGLIWKRSALFSNEHVNTMNSNWALCCGTWPGIPVHT